MYSERATLLSLHQAHLLFRGSGILCGTEYIAYAPFDTYDVLQACQSSGGKSC